MPALAEFAVDSSSSFVSASGEAAGENCAGVCVPSPSPSSLEDGGKGTLQVLIVGCGLEVQTYLQSRFGTSQWCLQQAVSGAAALNFLANHRIDVALVASSLPDLDALEFQQLVTAQYPGIQVLSLGDAPSPALTVSTRSMLSSLLDHHAKKPEPASDRSGTSSVGLLQPGWQGLLGTSAPMQHVFRVATMISRRDISVLIQGESGTGKDLLARAIHETGSRAKQPFVIINCAAIPDALLEAELFGYTKGSFTGASQSRLGRVHAAHGGTLFLDEIGEMPLSLQSKILRFLEQGEVQRIGESDTFKVNCRIIAATNVNLQQQVSARQFREDLYYRLAVMPIGMPPLRERMDDLPALCKGFLDRFCPGTVLHPRALDKLLQHNWPGNVRELRNVMERASLFAEGRREVVAEDILL